MYCIQTVTVLSVVFITVITILVVNFNKSNQIQQKFEEFVEKFNKSYKFNATDRIKRFSQFKKSIELIDQLNLLRPHPDSAQFGITPFSDLSADEFHKLYLRKKPSNYMEKKMMENSLKPNDIYYYQPLISKPIKPILTKSSGNRIKSGGIKSNGKLNRLKRLAVDNLPDKIDWREKGIISAVRNQGVCGSCWAHSVVENIESMFALERNTTVSNLSVQQMIDCAGNYNNGCEGGDTCNLLEWLWLENVAIELMNAYPLPSSGDSVCQMKLNGATTHPIVRNFTCDFYIDEEDKMVWLLANNGPIVATVNAQLWQNYLGGIIQFHCNGDYINLNHAVQIVGYDRTGDIPYYIVRNSWGIEFGDKGYLKIAIGGNVCGIANQVSTVDAL